MIAHRYTFEPYRGPASKHRCPECKRPRKFTRYVDTQTGEALADNVGRCDREDKCGYHYTPKQYFADNPTAGKGWQPTPDKRKSFIAPPPPPIDYLPRHLLEESRRHFNSNHLWKYFAARMGSAAAQFVFDRYQVGTSKRWPGATAFWQIDTAGNVRQCKVMQYDPITGKRIKQPDTRVYFAGKAIAGKPNPNLAQTLFGGHLLAQFPEHTVAIVESEKTAMYCSWYYPKYIWLATGGKQGCRWSDRNVFKALTGRTVVLVPDCGATADWQTKAEQVKALIPCRVSVEDLEQQATPAQIADGWDVMDFHLLNESPGPISNTTGPNGYPAWWDWPAPVVSVCEAATLYAGTVDGLKPPR